MDTFATACSVWNQERIHLVLVVKKTLYVLRKHTYTYVLSPASGLFRLHQKCQNRVTITPKNQLWKRVQVPKMSTQKKKNCRSGIPKKNKTQLWVIYEFFGGSHPPPTIILYVRHHHPKMMIYGGCFWIRGSQPWEGGGQPANDIIISRTLDFGITQKKTHPSNVHLWRVADGVSWWKMFHPLKEHPPKTNTGRWGFMLFHPKNKGEQSKYLTPPFIL